MRDCDHRPERDFYHDRLGDMPETAEFMKMVFCHRQPGRCARLLFIRANGAAEIPQDLLPNSPERTGERV